MPTSVPIARGTRNAVSRKEPTNRSSVSDERMTGAKRVDWVAAAGDDHRP